MSSSRPRFATPRDPDRPTRGPESLAQLTRLRRSLPFDWQADVAMTACELNDDLTGFRYPVVLLAVPRRAGKTTLTVGVNLDRLELAADARGWFTCANGREVAAKLFRDEISPMIEPLSRLYRIRRAQGSEGVHKRRGSSRWQLFAPTATALHSTNVDTATVDEAFAADIDQGEAIESGITPAQLTRPWRQLWIVSAGGTIESTWWDRWLQAGEQAVPGIAMFDYGADPTASGYDPGDPAVWAAAHPTAGVAFPMSVLQGLWDRRTDDASFERAYLNVWPRPSSVIAAAGLDLEVWTAARHPDVAAEKVTAIALDVAYDRSSASLATAGPNGDRVVVEVVDNRPGVAWLAGAVRELRGRHRGVPVLADALVAASVVAELARARVEVEPVGARDHGSACGTFTDRLTAGTVIHRGQAVLDDAVAGAARRPLGDAWLWSRARSSVDISPLVAVTLAGWGAATRRGGGRGQIVVANRHDVIRPGSGVRGNPPNRPPAGALRRLAPRSGPI